MPKEFGKYIQELRKHKRLSIRELQKKTGVSIAYLSQIENGKRGLPSPDILMKLHEPLGVSYDELMEKAGYISSSTRSELIPETIQTMESHEALNELISNAEDIFVSAITTEDGSLQNKYKEFLRNKVHELFPYVEEARIERALGNPQLIRNLFSNMAFEDKIMFLNDIIRDFVERGINPGDFINATKNGVKPNNSILRVPLLGKIAAGQPILTDEYIEEWVEIPNTWNLKQNDVILLEVKGDSMTGSRIYEGDKVVVKLQPDVENGEIAVVNVNGEEATLKKVKKVGNQVILFPDNPLYDPIFISDENARIIGKVIQVIFEPK